MERKIIFVGGLLYVLAMSYGFFCASFYFYIVGIKKNFPAAIYQ